jgi:hypothetical protein
MATLKNNRFIVGVLALTAVFALPRISAAQSTTSTFTVSFDRSGVPGTETVPVLDPVTGQPVIDPATGQPKTFTRDTGAFINPCTNAMVDLRGTTNVSITTTKTAAGVLKTALSETAKATGSAWTTPDNFATIVPSGTTYTVSETEQFTTGTLAGQLQRSEFSDRFAMRGPAGDKWIIRVTSTLGVDALGHSTVTIKDMTADSVCKG